jgi:hypothetical protein
VVRIPLSLLQYLIAYGEIPPLLEERGPGGEVLRTEKGPGGEVLGLSVRIINIPFI